ncbi:hypothetical protein QNH47_06270 [Virgibacillus halodenitrificans]|uniref:hypothetical protein n=1 Tax=Virgibacillus halodenitrificans TaxID=1482 RepID=UPI0024BF4435|nr:hypothetical protein [Virgibacillus halodenitrificans]WHX27458.1 hypothetical protein QNH47_06270 [Virgibacillus halodenitrificans]
MDKAYIEKIGSLPYDEQTDIIRSYFINHGIDPAIAEACIGPHDWEDDEMAVMAADLGRR